MVILPHGLLPLDFLVASHQLFLLFDLGFLHAELVGLFHICYLLQRSLHCHLLLDGPYSLLLNHPVKAFLHEEIIGGQGVGEQLVVLVGHLVGGDNVLEQRYQTNKIDNIGKERKGNFGSIATYIYAISFYLNVYPF